MMTNLKGYKHDTVVKKSKYLSFVLRHKPEDANLDMDSEGWVSVKQLTENSRIPLDLLKIIVAADEKQRYSFSFDESLIRANQGHSTPLVNLTFDEVELPPTTLYHGTHEGAAAQIEKTGLKPMGRHHVHLSVDIDTAREVGRRRGRPVIFAVAAGLMHAQGTKFYRSANGVYLVDQVPPPHTGDLRHNVLYRLEG